MKVLPESIAQWMPRPLVALGTDGFGRSESRASLRDFFEVDAKHIVLATLTALWRERSRSSPRVLQKAIERSGHQSGKSEPGHQLGRSSALWSTLARRTREHREESGTNAVTEFKLPELGENIDQGDLVRLMISPGATITEGQPVMELETDKAVVEVPSSVSGMVKEIRVKEGEKIKVGQVIFTVENGAGGEGASASSPKDRKAAASCCAQPQPCQPQPAEARRRRASRRLQLRAHYPLDRRSRSEFKLPELGENISPRRSGAADDFSGRESLRGPAGDGTGNRQGGGRSSSSMSGVSQRSSGKEGEKVKVGPGHLHR